MSKQEFGAAKFLLVNTETAKLQFYERGRLIKTYPIAVGKAATPTPTGEYKIVSKIYNPGGNLGTRWLGLSVPHGHYGIHGTNNPASIGKKISNGCIRMHNKDVEELFAMVTLKTPVLITDLAEQINLAPTQEKETDVIKSEDVTAIPAEDNALKEDVAEDMLEAPQNNTVATEEEIEQSVEQPQPPAATIYMVRPGDTLWSIARSFEIPIQRIMELNNLPAPNFIFPGQKLLIPLTNHSQKNN